MTRLVMVDEEALVERIRSLLADAPQVSERRVFGGIGWAVRGNVAVGVSGRGDLVVRTSVEESASLVSEEGVSPVELGGRRMRGWVRVEALALMVESALQRWVSLGRVRALERPPAGDLTRPCPRISDVARHHDNDVGLVVRNRPWTWATP
ncbi:MAG: TfoX/Sxy family protein [Myxococcales bacterium]|nr:TfoX/Sxy family protein [Myxococcales bacterium]